MPSPLMTRGSPSARMSHSLSSSLRARVTPLLTALRHPAPDVRYAACNALVHLHVADAIGPLEELARDDTSTTSWGASVSEAANRAAQGIASERPTRLDDEFARVSALLQQHHED